MIANAAPSIHDYNEQRNTSKGKGKSLTDTEDDSDESLQKAIDQSIRESPLAPNTILPPRKGLLLDISMMSTTMVPVETIGFTVAAPTKEEQIKKAFGKAMKKYDPPGQPPGGPSGWGPPGGGGGLPGGEGGPPGGGGGSPCGAAPTAGGARQPATPHPHGTPHSSQPDTCTRDRGTS